MAKSASNGIPITNDAQLTKLLQDIVEKVISNVSFKITLILQKRIRQDTYGSHPANRYYYNGSKQPTFEFLSAWEWKGIQKDLNKVVREMYYDYTKMRNDPETFLHGSTVKGWPRDVRPMLAEWLDKSGPSSSLWISVNREPYWQNLLDELFNQKKLDRMFSEEFAKFGVYRR